MRPSISPSSSPSPLFLLLLLLCFRFFHFNITSPFFTTLYHSSLCSSFLDLPSILCDNCERRLHTLIKKWTDGSTITHSSLPPLLSPLSSPKPASRKTRCTGDGENSLTFSLSHFLSLSQLLSLSLTFCLSLSVSHFLSLTFCLSLSVSLSLSQWSREQC
jgi:hypothetical protein